MFDKNGNKLWVCLDTEGTSVSTSHNRIICLGAVLFQETPTIIRPVKIREHFFSSVKQIPTGAVMVHGLTREILQEKSKGKSFEDSREDIKDLFYSGYNVLGHNVVNYDIPTIQANVTNAGWALPEFTEVADTLVMCRDQLKSTRSNGHIENFKLETVFKYVLKKTGVAVETHKRVFRMLCNNSESSDSAHQAAWDAYMTFVIYKYLRGK